MNHGSIKSELKPSAPHQIQHESYYVQPGGYLRKIDIPVEIVKTFEIHVQPTSVICIRMIGF